jgi:hypothetical protein
MNNFIKIVLIFLFLNGCFESRGQDTLDFSGQASAWLHYNNGNELPVYFGVRYIPQVNYALSLKEDSRIDFEASANIYGTVGLSPFDSVISSGRIKAYRLWARYSTRQFELRAGLQKINFGSASILRPLMWFDQVDPRDPLKLTDGVWGILGRYYFLNNINIWLWGLYGNNDPKGWEINGTNRQFPEGGGRIQIPVPAGEAGLSYHFRVADTRDYGDLMPQYSEVNENRIAFDIKLDLFTGVWFEGSWVTNNKDLGIFTNQEILNAGIDYTFGIGNGLYAVFEQLVAAFGEQPFDLKNASSFSLLSMSYPLGISGRVGSVTYFDWKNQNGYNCVNLSKQFRNTTLYLIGYWNPENNILPAGVTGKSQFYGRGIQAMIVLNH